MSRKKRGGRRTPSGRKPTCECYAVDCSLCQHRLRSREYRERHKNDPKPKKLPKEPLSEYELERRLNDYFNKVRTDKRPNV